MEFIALLCLVGGIQGIFLTFHFFFKESGKSELNRLVAVMLLVYSINLVNTYTFLEGLISMHEVLQPISNYISWWVGPSIYFYVCFPSVPQSWKRAIWLHYGPVVFIAFFATIWPETVPYFGILFYLQFTVYLAVSVIKISKGEIDRKLLSFIKPLIFAVALIKVANIVLISLDSANVWKVSDSSRISFIILAAFPIFLIAYREMNATKTFIPSEDNYGKSGVESSEVRKYFEQLKSVIEEEKLYLNPNLKLEDVALRTNIHKRKISQVINEYKGENFNVFINKYRLQEVATRLKNPENSHLSILGIARESGFNSGGRFNSLFKKEYGLTPSEYRENRF